MSRETLIKDTKRVLTGFDDNESRFFVRYGTEGCIPISRDYIALYADEACLEACELLYDLNIQTYTSGANTDGLDNKCWDGFIGIIYDTLSDENKQIVELMIEKKIIEPVGLLRDGKTKAISLRVPLTSRSTVGEISDKLMSLASFFKEQDVLYARTTREELDKKNYVKLDNGMYHWVLLHAVISEEQKKKYLEEELQCLFHDNDGNYFLTEELLQKHLKYQQNKEKHI